MELILAPVTFIRQFTPFVEQFPPPVHLVVLPLPLVKPPILVVELPVPVSQATKLVPFVLGASLVLLNDVLMIGHIHLQIGLLVPNLR